MRIHRREFGFLVLGIGLILALAYYLFVASPALEREGLLQKNIVKKEKDLREMMALRQEWERFRERKVEAEKALKGRKTNFTLLSFLEGISRKGGISENIQYMKPVTFPEEPGNLQPEGMQIELKEINTDQLVRFLTEIEQSGNTLSIQRIKISRSSVGETHLLKVVLQIKSYKPA